MSDGELGRIDERESGEGGGGSREVREGSKERLAGGEKKRKKHGGADYARIAGSPLAQEHLAIDAVGGSSSPTVAPYPVSLRQQLALIKQMEQPSPSGSTDGGEGTLTSKKRVSKVHKKNTRGETPLHVAAKKGDEALCLQLLNEGAEVNCADYAGWTPLHEACSHDWFDIAKLLIRFGADVNLASVDEETPLHDAAANNNRQIVWLLLCHGADREKKNCDHKRPIDSCDDEKTRHLLLADKLPQLCPPDSPTSSPRKEEDRRAPPSRDEKSSASASPAPSMASVGQMELPHTVAQPLSVAVDDEEMEQMRPESEPSRSGPPSTTTSLLPHPLRSPLDNKKAVDKEQQKQNEKVEEDEKKEDQEKEEEEREMSEELDTPLVVDERNLEEEGTMNDTNRDAPEAPPPSTPQAEKKDETPPARIALIQHDDGLESSDDDDEEEVGDEEDATLIDEENDEQQDSIIAAEDSMESSRQSSEAPESKKSAVWKSRVGGSSIASHSPQPQSTYDFVEDEARSESGGYRRGSRGKRGGRAARPSSGRTTPSTSATAEKKKNTRGGGNRGRRGGRGASRTLETEPALTGSDVYEFRSSPESENSSEFGERHDDREVSLTPSAKKARLAENSPTASTVNDMGDLEMEDPEDDFDDTASRSPYPPGRKVPPLRISLTNKTPSEEDPQEEPPSHSISRKVLQRGRPGKRAALAAAAAAEAAAADDATRMTRSRVRQTGKQLDDVDPSVKKRRGRSLMQTADDDMLDESSMADNTNDSTMDTVAPSESSSSSSIPSDSHVSTALLQGNPVHGRIVMKKMLAQRWLQDSQKDNSEVRAVPEKFSNFLKYTGDYALDGDEPRVPQEDGKEVAKILCFVGEKMRQLYDEQREDRYRILRRQEVEKTRLQLAIEHEIVRRDSRIKGTSTLLSATRILRESEMCNPLVLDKAITRPKPCDKDQLISKMKQKIESIYRRHKYEVENLRKVQRDRWKAALEGNLITRPDSELDILVPMATPTELRFNFNVVT